MDTDLAFEKMRMVVIYAALGAMAMATISLAQVPIPRRYDGFSYHPIQNEPVLLEAFFDPLCPYSKASWPAVEQLIQELGPRLCFTLHTFPLPYHHNSFFSSRALHIVHKMNSSLTYPVLELFFKHQDDFSNQYTSNETPDSVIKRFGKLVSEQFGNDLFDNFIAGFNDQATDQATRISFKYACSRGITGTPIFLLNGVRIEDADSTWSVDDWRNLVAPLLIDPRALLIDPRGQPGTRTL